MSVKSTVESTLIRHENRALENALQTGEIAKPWLCVLAWTEIF